MSNSQGNKQAFTGRCFYTAYDESIMYVWVTVIMYVWATLIKVSFYTINDLHFFSINGRGDKSNPSNNNMPIE